MDRRRAISPGPSTPGGNIVVTGYRASLRSSTNAKKRSVGFVDTIFAEDIGKFPDTNIAESFNRIPGVTITLINEQTNVSRETTTNAVGEYSFPAVDPSAYTVRAVVAGFKTFERKGFRIGTQQFLTLDVILEVGALEESITVIGESPLIETANASTGEVLDTKSLESIPTAGRSVFLMANLQPTVQTSGNAHWNRMQDQVGNSAMSMGGGAVRANNYLVDGFPVTDLQNRASTNPSIEAVQEGFESGRIFAG